MLKEKKLIVLLSLLGAATSCFAAADPTATKPGFEFNVSALWLQPSATNLNYTIYNKAIPAPSPRWTEQELSPNYDPAFEVGVRYVFLTSPDNDANLNWTHFYSSTSSSTVAPNGNFFLGPDYLIGPPATTIRRADGNVQFHYDQVNLDFGQYINFKRVKVRLFLGITNPYLGEEIKTTFSGAGAFGNFSMLQDVDVNFSGAGPRIGMSGAYNAGCGFGVMGEGGVAAILGNLHTKTNFTGNAETGTRNNNQFLRDQTTTQVIPEFDAKLGLNYKYVLHNSMQITATLGYQAAIYMNAISQYLPGSLLNIPGVPTDFSSGGIFVATVNHTLSNYTIQGPFFNLALAI